MLTSFKVRTLIFQLMTASRDTEAELVCVDSYGKKSGMGVLSGGGFMFTVPLNLIRKLLNKVGTTNTLYSRHSVTGPLVTGNIQLQDF